MKRIICNACRAEVEPDGYGLAPAGWFSVTYRGDVHTTADYCSAACVIAHAPSLPPAAKPKAAA